MAKPSYDEVVAERDTLREKVIDLNAERKALVELLKPDGEECLVEAAQRLRSVLGIEREENVVMRAELAGVRADLNTAAGRAQALAKGRTDPAVESGLALDGSGWPLKPGLQDVRGVKTPAYLRWLAAEHPEIWNAKCGGEPPQAD